MEFLKSARPFVVRGPDCGCGGECPGCLAILRSMHRDHAWEIKKATEHLPEKGED